MADVSRCNSLAARCLLCNARPSHCEKICEAACRKSNNNEVGGRKRAGNDADAYKFYPHISSSIQSPPRDAHAINVCSLPRDVSESGNKSCGLLGISKHNKFACSNVKLSRSFGGGGGMRKGRKKGTEYGVVVL